MCQEKVEKGERETVSSERTTGWLERRARYTRYEERESMQAYSEGPLPAESPRELAKVPSLERMPFLSFSLLSADFPQEKKQLPFASAGGPQGIRQVLSSQSPGKQAAKA